MRYKSFSTILFAISLFILTILEAYYLYKGGKWYIAIIPIAVITIGHLVFKTPINKWSFKYQDVDIDDQVMMALETEYPIISSYNADERKEFRQRMFHFLFDRESYLVLGDSQDLDLYHTALISAPGVIMGMQSKTFDRCDDINRIVAYKHAFPTPKMKVLHTAEYDEEDGVMIVSIEHMMLSLRNREGFYHIVYHVWAERFVEQHEDFPKYPPEFVENIEQIFGVSQKKIEDILGYDNPNKKVLALVAYFTRRSSLQKYFPNYFMDISGILSYS